jgi:hypothetical protein
LATPKILATVQDVDAKMNNQTTIIKKSRVVSVCVFNCGYATAFLATPKMKK